MKGGLNLEEHSQAEDKFRKRIRRGYERLAFGTIADAVRLILAEEPNLPELGKMDLYNIAEIKRPKGGGMEIKFFDRIKALQCLEAMDCGNGKALPLYTTLQECARSLRENGDGV